MNDNGRPARNGHRHHQPPETLPRPAADGVRRLAYSPDEAADSLGVSRDFLDEHVGPELRWVRRGRRKLVAVAELERWLAESSARTLDAA